MEGVGDVGPPVEFGEEEREMVKWLQWWWRRSLEKGKGKEVVVNGEKEVNGNGREVNGHAHVKPKMKYKARRGGGKVVNLNR